MSPIVAFHPALEVVMWPHVWFNLVTPTTHMPSWWLPLYQVPHGVQW